MKKTPPRSRKITRHDEWLKEFLKSLEPPHQQLGVALQEAHEQVLRNKIGSIRGLPGASAQERSEMIQMIRAEARLRFDFDF
jgi:hypothetical protein